MKRYTEDELLNMSEKKARSLFESGKMDDDDMQRWYDLKDEASWLAQDFIENELRFYL